METRYIGIVRGKPKKKKCVVLANGVVVTVVVGSSATITDADAPNRYISGYNIFACNSVVPHFLACFFTFMYLLKYLVTWIR